MTPERPRADAETAIRAAGLRVTATRCAVFDALGTHAHARADEVLEHVSGRLDVTSLQSVYNALGDLVDAGLVRRIEPAGQPGLFELSAHDNHHHVVCNGCGRVEDVACVVGEAPCLSPSQTHGYVIDTAEVTFWGLCPDCAATAETSTHPITKGSPT